MVFRNYLIILSCGMYAVYTKLKELFPFPKRIYLLQNWIIPYDCFLAVAKAQVTGLTSFFWLSYLFFIFLIFLIFLD